MFKIFRGITREVLEALSPIILVIVILQFSILHVPLDVFLRFLIGSAMVVAGVIFFLFGVRRGILPMGRDIGAEIPQRGSLLLIVVVASIFGFAVTATEPGVIVLRNLSAEAGGNTGTALIFVIAGGMAVLFTTALLRILFGFPIKYLLAIVYGVALVLALITPPDFLSIAFDAGAVAAGSFTVPMLLALGLGFVSVLPHRSALSDGFGLIGLACAGPLISILLWGIFFF